MVLAYDVEIVAACFAVFSSDCKANAQPVLVRCGQVCALLLDLSQNKLHIVVLTIGCKFDFWGFAAAWCAKNFAI